MVEIWRSDEGFRMKLKGIIRLNEAINWNTKSEKEQLQLVRGNGQSVKFIQNPSAVVQMAAVRQDAFALKFITHPHEAVIIAAINQNSDIFSYIANNLNLRMSETVQLAAVKANSWNINEIAKPSEAVQLAAVNKHYTAILDIKNPTQSVIKFVLTTQRVINDAGEYKALVQHLFSNNALLARKWIRYGENMRNNNV